MKKYLVGGAVRDSILGREIRDRDWVVVGTTMDKMHELGYKKVGSHFPVFLDEFGEEYALARREVSTGPGYKDFAVEFDEYVTIQEDLYRRDFTINSIAYDEENGVYVDPYGGIKDLFDGTIRMTNKTTFRDDPLRVLRAIRFSINLDFMIEDETNAVVVDMIKGGCLNNLPSERIGMEIMKIVDNRKVVEFIMYLYQNDIYEQFHMSKDDIETLLSVCEDHERDQYLVLFGCFKSQNEFLKFADFCNLSHEVREKAKVYYKFMTCSLSDSVGTIFTDVIDFCRGVSDTPRLDFFRVLVNTAGIDHFSNIIEIYRSVGSGSFPNLSGRELGKAITKERIRLIDNFYSENYA